MNPLELIKDKLRVKPALQERKPVEIVLQRKDNSSEGKEDKEENPKKEDEQNRNEQENKEQSTTDLGSNTNKLIIIDKREEGFDRSAFLKKLEQKNQLQVKTKPLVKASEEYESKTPILAPIKKAKKMILKPKLIIEDEEEEEQVPEKQNQIPEPKETLILQGPPAKKERKTKKIEKGITILGPESNVILGDNSFLKRLPRKEPKINIRVSDYYMNNREIFVNFINSLFEPYRKEIQENKESISCDSIGQENSDFSPLTHQKIVRDYMNLYTPYRGLLLYHGLGSGKTCTSIAIAEGMKESKKVIIMTPASLRTNYMEELKKCGDLLYKKNQFWEWIPSNDMEQIHSLSIILNLPAEYIKRKKGAWLVNIKNKSNYSELTSLDKKSLDDQLDEMIRNKYIFINYNGLRNKRLEELTSGYTKNLFDNAIVIIDEAHNFVSRIVNKIKKEKEVEESDKGEKMYSPKFLSVKLYEYLLSAENSRIVLLTGTPVINYPNEFAILFNILRGYIKTWEIQLDIKTNSKIDKNSLNNMLLVEKTLDYLDYSPSSKILTITRNPFGFKNKFSKKEEYLGVNNFKKIEDSDILQDQDFLKDDVFERKIINILKSNDIDILPRGVKIRNKKALPDTLELFEGNYIEETTGQLKNIDSLKRRILGLSSYFRSAQESLLPKYDKILGEDYHIIRIPMSNYQFKIYEDARKEERLLESKSKRKVASKKDDLFKEPSSTYRIFSRLFCNFVMPNRPLPRDIKMEQIAKGMEGPIFKGKEEEEKEEEKEDEKEEEEEEDEKEKVGKEGEKHKKITKQKKEKNNMEALLKEARKAEDNQDVNDDQEGEVEGDEVLEKIGGNEYKKRIEKAIQHLEENSNDYLTPEALEIYSPKYLHILENIQDPDHIGLHLVYSQFRTLEGVGIFSLVLKKNGFAQFKIKKNTVKNEWTIDIPEEDKGKPTFALYSGTETAEEKEIIRNVYNGDWNYLPTSISNELKQIANNNRLGEIIKVLMITSSGSEGINLRNTRYVHIMEPYWHPVRLEQVIGRARRICSHKDLPKNLQTVEVFVYLMIFSPEQLKSDASIELKRKDLSKSIPHVPITSDQFLYEISELKGNLTNQLTDIIKQSAFDCYIYSNGKCVNFGEPTNTKFSYVPNYSEQQSDITVKSNIQKIEWVGKSITINGTEYIYKRVSPKKLNIYDKNSYLDAVQHPGVNPVLIGIYEINEKGQQIFKSIS